MPITHHLLITTVIERGKCREIGRLVISLQLLGIRHSLILEPKRMRSIPPTCRRPSITTVNERGKCYEMLPLAAVPSSPDSLKPESKGTRSILPTWRHPWTTTAAERGTSRKLQQMIRLPPGYRHKTIIAHAIKRKKSNLIGVNRRVASHCEGTLRAMLITVTPLRQSQCGHWHLL